VRTASFIRDDSVRTSETSVDKNFTWQYIPEDNSEHHTRRRENFKSHIGGQLFPLRTPDGKLRLFSTTEL
jgi:hypothetical protein